MPAPVRAVIVTNIPTPHRIPVYERVHDAPDVDLKVLYAAERESNRSWAVPPSRVPHRVLRSWTIRWRGRYIHTARGVAGALRSARPDVVMTTGFNPLHLAAILWAVAHRVPHVVSTDGTERSEARLGRLHALARRWTARRSAAFVATGPEGVALARSWGAVAEDCFVVPLVLDPAFGDGTVPRDLDLLFSGRLAPEKHPLLALDVAEGVAARLGRRVRVAVLGDGPLQPDVAARAAALEHVDVELAGFQPQQALPGWYARSRVFLFPTSFDPWGLVANEAAACGTPQLIGDEAGAAGDLVIDGEAGFVLPLEVERWVEAAVLLLTDEARWTAMSAEARRAAAPRTRAAAAEGLRAALLHAAGRASS